MSNTAAHLTDDQLELFALGRLPEEEQETAEEHLLVCASCRARLDDEAETARAFRTALGDLPPEKTRFWQVSWFRPVMAMAALLLALAVFRFGGGTGLAPVASLQLTAIRGEMPKTAAAAEYDLTLTDVPNSGQSFRVELVDSNGGRRWQGELRDRDVRVRDSLSAGVWFLRLYDFSGRLVHEYGFQVE